MPQDEAGPLLAGMASPHGALSPRGARRRLALPRSTSPAACMPSPRR